jgi:hypothetical protein
VSPTLARNLGALALVLVPLAALAAWIAFNVHWETITVPTPPKGEALDNPYYALEHFAADLGIHTREISTVRGLAPETVLVFEEPGDELTHPPVEALENWVESGGRLVISSVLLDSYPALKAWSGIKWARASPPPAQTPPAAPAPAAPASAASGPAQKKPNAAAAPAHSASDSDCPLMTVRADGAPTGQSFRVCYAGPTLGFDGDRAPAWSLSDDRGMHVIRTGVGFGEVTVLEPAGVLGNAMLKRADHAEMFAAAAGLRHDDTLLIFHPATAEPLPALLWRLAAPGMLFLLAALLAVAWRHAPRFGPPLPPPTPVRRSLAEQIRANARFAWRTHRLEGLRTSARRSLDEAAARHIAGYGALDAAERAERLAALTGLDAAAIRAARTEVTPRRLNEERAAITLMEVCRRILLRMHWDHPRPLV